MRKISWVIICVGFFLGLLAFGGTALAADPIKVGIVDSYSGPPSTYTNDVKDGFKLAIDKINAGGGVLGRQITFVTRDDKFKVDLGLSAAKELVMREKVDLLMGTINSAVALAISDFAKKEKVPFLATYSKTANLTGSKGHKYVFSMNENTEMAGKAAAVGLAKLPYVNYWIAGDDYEYGHAIADGVWNNLKKLKPDVKLLGQSWWKVGEPDFTPYITSILSAKPDAVIIATGGAGCVPFLKAAKATGFNEKSPFFMHTSTELSTLRPLGVDAPEGVIGTSNYYFYFPETPENKAFVEEFQKAYGRYPSFGSLIGWFTGQFIAKAYEKAGKVDPEKFAEALSGMTIDSPIGKLTIRAEDNQVMLPMFMGKTKKKDGFDFLIATDIVTIPAADLMPLVEDIKKAREKEK
ncbi:MAG: ABC transporter substrate-binding protein [Desulfomonile tiedjei]|uniref:ABC transporter substrate-binding protein n=1 Tax=Desulfomonile tiedjei TaxID=2358 RepID=A0A9D6YZ26_9BACT|nr:ABC transporter substrate-binding protein [Desulfomonile tiedjei]